MLWLLLFEQEEQEQGLDIFRCDEWFAQHLLIAQKEFQIADCRLQIFHYLPKISICRVR